MNQSKDIQLMLLILGFLLYLELAYLLNFLFVTPKSVQLTFEQSGGWLGVPTPMKLRIHI